MTNNTATETQARETLRAFVAAAPSKACGRCSGTGYLAHFAHVVDGMCAACSGSGRVLTRREDKAAARALEGRVELARLRGRWMEARAALRAAEAAPATGPAWSRDFAIDDARRRLEGIEWAGKELAARLGAA